MSTPYDKLVRDNIPQIIADEGGTAEFRTLTQHKELSQYAEKKLHEELREVLSATTKTEITEELADLMEIARKYADINGIHWDEVEEARHEKKSTKGGFDSNIVLVRKT